MKALPVMMLPLWLSLHHLGTVCTSQVRISVGCLRSLGKCEAVPRRCDLACMQRWFRHTLTLFPIAARDLGRLAASVFLIAPNHRDACSRQVLQHLPQRRHGGVQVLPWHRSDAVRRYALLLRHRLFGLPSMWRGCMLPSQCLHCARRCYTSPVTVQFEQ